MASAPYVLSIAGTAISLFIAGGISGISLLTVPVILQQTLSDAQLLQLWKAIFNRGKARAPLVAGAASFLHLSSAYLRRSSSGVWPVQSIVAASMTIAIAPFTLVAMGSTNDKLMTAAGTGSGKEATRSLISTWSMLNLVRGMLPLVGGLLGMLNLSSLQ